MENSERNYNEKFEKLLTKICLDFKINNYKEEIGKFMKKNKKINDKN